MGFLDKQRVTMGKLGDGFLFPIQSQPPIVIHYF